MRGLVGPRPQIDVVQAEMVAVEGERARLGPGLDDQVVRLVEALVRKIWIGARGVVFRADAAHEAGDDAALRQTLSKTHPLGISA